MTFAILNGMEFTPKCERCGSTDVSTYMENMEIDGGSIAAVGEYECCKCGRKGRFSMDENDLELPKPATKEDVQRWLFIFPVCAAIIFAVILALLF